MSRSVLVLVLLAIGACGDDDGTGDLGDLVTIDGSVAEADGAVDGETCEPSGSCLQGPPCGDDCCGSGERCVQGELGPECACGDGPACEVGDTCSSGVPSEDQCGSVCCGAGDPCPP